MCAFMMKVRDVRAMNAFSQTLCGNMFSTFAVGTSTDLKECITTCTVQFASDVRVYDESLRCVVNAFSQTLRGNVFPHLLYVHKLN
jgi:hypothetical protein